MSHLAALLLPPIIALLLSLHLGYAWARIMLPPSLRPYRAVLLPLLGLALLITLTAVITTTTRLTPPQIALGLVILAAPINIVVRRTENRAQRTKVRLAASLALLGSLFFVLCSSSLFSRRCAGAFRRQ